MGMLPTLDTRAATYDRFRGAVMVPAGGSHVAVVHEALESYVNRRLTPEEAVEAVIEEKAILTRVANSVAAHDNIITITSGILNSRSWDLLPGEEE